MGGSAGREAGRRIAVVVSLAAGAAGVAALDAAEDAEDAAAALAAKAAWAADEYRTAASSPAASSAPRSP